MRLASENYTDSGDIDAILDMKRVAVVGVSADPARDSNHVARYLQRHGYTIIPVNPKESEVLGEKAYASLLDLPEAPDVVDVFRRPEAVPEVVEQAIQIGAKAVWMQLGVINEEAAKRAREAGLIVVMDRCMRIEHGHRRLEAQ